MISAATPRPTAAAAHAARNSFTRKPIIMGYGSSSL
jgi:hypothetical protein